MECLFKILIYIFANIFKHTHLLSNNAYLLFTYLEGTEMLNKLQNEFVLITCPFYNSKNVMIGLYPVLFTPISLNSAHRSRLYNPATQPLVHCHN